jgi:hypothetical protein
VREPGAGSPDPELLEVGLLRGGQMAYVPRHAEGIVLVLDLPRGRRCRGATGDPQFPARPPSRTCTFSSGAAGLMLAVWSAAGWGTTRIPVDRR